MFTKKYINNKCHLILFIFILPFSGKALCDQVRKCNNPVFPVKACNFQNFLKQNPDALSVRMTLFCIPDNEHPYSKMVHFRAVSPGEDYDYNPQVYDEADLLVAENYDLTSKMQTFNRCTGELTWVELQGVSYSSGSCYVKNHVEYEIEPKDKIHQNYRSLLQSNNPETSMSGDEKAIKVMAIPCRVEKKIKCSKGASQCEKALKTEKALQIWSKDINANKR
ncbi:hypothetical protein HC024_13965 [Methylococcaceae bacterium WWC4]|nr:hypothetical protein [Methylococcaceae bacterium WWC4]